MGIVTKRAIILETSNFYGPSPSTPNPQPSPRCWVPPPPLRATFCMTRFYAPPPLYHTLLWKMGSWETYDMENMNPPPFLNTYSCRPGN